VVDNGQVRFGIGFSHLWKAGCWGWGDEVLLGRNIVNHVVIVNKGKMSMCETRPPI